MIKFFYTLKIRINQNINFYLINEKVHVNDSKAFIEYSNNMDNIYKNIEEYNPNKKRKILIVFDDMFADMLSNKKLNSIVTELFIRIRKLNISLVFIAQSYFKVPEDIILNTTHFFIMKISKKRELQQIAFNNSSYIEFKDFKNLNKNVLQNHILFQLLMLLLY